VFKGLILKHIGVGARTEISKMEQYKYTLRKDVSVNDGPHIRRWSHKIIIL